MKKIPLFKVFMSPNAVSAVSRVLKSGFIAEGKEVIAFEEEFGHYFKKNNCVAVNSATSALELSYELAGIADGDEVIAPVLTFNGANLPIVRRRAKIVFADINPETFNLDSDDVEKRITNKTKAIIFVHFGGCNDGLSEIISLGQKYNIPVIEDAAQAIGSSNWGNADFTIVSFQAIKMLTTGDGGMLICKNEIDAKHAKRLRWFGMDREERHRTGDSDIFEPGYKFHMNNIAAAIGRANLKALNPIIAHRSRLSAFYNSYKFKKNIPVTVHAGSWACRVITDDRDDLRKYLLTKGIESGIHHFRNDIYSVFGKKRLKLPNMNKMENKYFFIPHHHAVSIADARYILKMIENYFNK